MGPALHPVCIGLQAEGLRRDVDDRSSQRRVAEEGLQAAQRALADAQSRLSAAESSAAAQVSPKHRNIAHAQNLLLTC